MNKRFLKSTVAAIVISAFTLVGCSNSNKELAKVGNYVITHEVVNRKIKPYIDSYKKYYTDLTDAELKEYEDMLKEDFINYISEVEAVYQEAEKNNYKVEQKIIDENYDSFVEQILTYFDMDIEEYCTKYNFDVETLKEDVRKETIANNYLFDICKPSEDEIKTYYEENKESFKMIRASHILISNENEISPDDSELDIVDGSHTHDDGTKHKELTKEETDALNKIKEENLKKAENILTKAKNGDDFKKLSDQYSDDTVAKENGGDLDFFTFNTMVEPFAKAAFDTKLKKNEVYDKVVVTDFGYHIIKKTDEKQQTLEEVTSEIEEYLSYEEMEKVLDTIRTKYNIKSPTESSNYDDSSNSDDSSK